MSIAQPRATRPLVNGIALLFLIGVLTVVMFAALRSPLKDDIAWLLYVARRWMAGRELYVDVVEVNPPLIVWISAIPLAVSNWLVVNPQFVALPAFAAIVLGCAWWSACLLRAMGDLFAARMPVFAVIGSTLLFIPAGDLGQREHLLVAAFLPYLILFARNLAQRGGGTLDGKPPSTAASLAVGVLAGLGCALKPQYGLVFVALEIVALRHRMRPWRPAPIAAAATMVGYVGLVAYACPAYLQHAVPMALALYGATDVSFLALFKDSAPLLAAEVLVFFLWWHDQPKWHDGPEWSGGPERSDWHVLPYPVLLLTGMIFAAASTAICFIDGKDWFYHRLPATVVTVLLLILWAAATIRSRGSWRMQGGISWRSLGCPPWRASRRTQWGGPIVAGLVVALFCVAAVRRLEPQVQQAVEPKATTVARLEALIRLHHARTYIAFSEWIALGFPVVNNTGVVWASRFDSMWALKGELWRAHVDPTTAKEWPITHWVAHDFTAACPDIAVVDTREGLNYITVLSAAEPSFAHAWSRYKQIVAFDGLKVYKRGKGGCIDPWIAAEGLGNGITIR